MSDDSNWEELIDRHLRGELTESEKERLAELLDRDSSARRDFVEHAQWDTRLADVLRATAANSEDSPEALLASRVILPIPEHTPTKTVTRTLLAIAALIIIGLSITLYIQQPTAEHEIARIAGLSGPLLWTGDGGRVFHDLSLGTELPGGTIEGMAPASWFALEFNDGSTVTISGNSMLTFSDHGQKKLHLRKGRVSFNVKRQPPSKPMLVHTRSAMIEVLGTQFEVESELSATMLNVSEGKVRVTRLSDGSTVDVPAEYRVVAAADHELSPLPVPKSVNRWKSQLHLGPDGTQGNWSPKTEEEDAKLRAIPYDIPDGRTIYALGFAVSRGDKPPVKLPQDSRFRVQGRIETSHEVYFGVTIRHPNGEFAGRFQTILPAAEFPDGVDFEVILDLRDFQLDPTLIEMKNKLPSFAFDLIEESFWCHTLYKQAGLEIYEVELIPASKID